MDKKVPNNIYGSITDWSMSDNRFYVPLQYNAIRIKLYDNIYGWIIKR